MQVLGEILYRMLEEHDGAKRLAPRPGHPRQGLPDVGYSIHQNPHPQRGVRLVWP